ncbi:hypothetical protein FOA52_000798 [Chlamydomonas sp. UWO 241]|nr:hypothetical protein FOA52_000798 [Chlamydomonas sp. UWO 241]
MATQQASAAQLAGLDVQQLQQLKERINADLAQFQRSGQQLSIAASKFQESAVSVAQLAEAKEGHQLLLPLTQSLYVNGKIGATDKVMIDIGTGYFVELTTAEGQSYCTRKVQKLQDSLKNVSKILQERQAMLNQVVNMMQRKMQAQANAAQASGSA